MSAIKEFLSFVLEYGKANIRNRRLMAAERIALRLTNKDRRTRYIIRGRGNKYIIFTNMEVDTLKNRGILRADLNIYTLSIICDSEIAYCGSRGGAYIKGKQNG